MLVDPDHPGPEVIGPGYLCAHPDLDYFLVVKSQAPIEIPSGVVSISNDTKKLLPIAYDCNLPIPKNVNPTLQDIVVFQYDKKEDMVESIATTGPYFGTVTETTNGCINPSRGSGPKGSWHLVGLHIDAGSASAYQACLSWSSSNSRCWPRRSHGRPEVRCRRGSTKLGTKRKPRWVTHQVIE